MDDKSILSICLVNVNYLQIINTFLRFKGLTITSLYGSSCCIDDKLSIKILHFFVLSHPAGLKF